jgi:AcrR family transcriptional regulator
MEPPPPPGLRERKKAKTRDAIVEAAVRLFVAQGFEETTIEQIAAAAEVAPRTFFRYFPSKEDVVFQDQDVENAVIREVIAHRKPGEGDIDLFLRAFTAVLAIGTVSLERSRDLYHLLDRTPSLRARAYQVTQDLENMSLAAMLPKRASRAEQIRARALIAGLIGALRSTIVMWMDSGMRGDPMEIGKQVAHLFKHSFGDH